MHELTVEKIAYSGSDFRGTVESMVPSDFDPKRLRVEVYIDDSDLREPYFIERNIDELGSGSWDWEIDRRWPFDAKIDIELWVTPADAQIPPQRSYEHVDTKIGEGAVSSPSGGTLDPGVSGVTVPYAVGSAPDPVTVEVRDPDTGTGSTHVEFPPAVQSAIADFERDDDDGLDFLSKDDVVSVAKRLSSRVDIVGIEGSTPDGFPDKPMQVPDQDGTDFCSPTAVLLAFGLHRPRRAVEFCRSIYQPMAFDASGDRLTGYLAASATVELKARGIKQYKKSVSNGFGGRTAAQGVNDVLVVVLRATILALPPIDHIGNMDQYRSFADSGLVVVEIMKLLEVAVGATDPGQYINVPGHEALELAAADAANDKISILKIDALLVRPYGPTTEGELNATWKEDAVDINHAVTLLTLSGGGSDPYTFVFQNPWGGTLESRTVSEAVLDKYLEAAIVANAEANP